VGGDVPGVNCGSGDKVAGACSDVGIVGCETTGDGVDNVVDKSRDFKVAGFFDGNSWLLMTSAESADTKTGFRRSIEIVLGEQLFSSLQ